MLPKFENMYLVLDSEVTVNVATFVAKVMGYKQGVIVNNPKYFVLFEHGKYSLLHSVSTLQDTHKEIKLTDI